MEHIFLGDISNGVESCLNEPYHVTRSRSGFTSLISSLISPPPQPVFYDGSELPLTINTNDLEPNMNPSPWKCEMGYSDLDERLGVLGLEESWFHTSVDSTSSINYSWPFSRLDTPSPLPPSPLPPSPLPSPEVYIDLPAIFEEDINFNVDVFPFENHLYSDLSFASPTSEQSPNSTLSSHIWKCPHNNCTFQASGKRGKAYPAYLRKHLKTHEDCRYPCPQCGKVFTRPDNQKSHAKKAHKGSGEPNNYRGRSKLPGNRTRERVQRAKVKK